MSAGRAVKPLTACHHEGPSRPSPDTTLSGYYTVATSQRLYNFNGAHLVSASAMTAIFSAFSVVYFSNDALRLIPWDSSYEYWSPFGYPLTLGRDHYKAQLDQLHTSNTNWLPVNHSNPDETNWVNVEQDSNVGEAANLDDLLHTGTRSERYVLSSSYGGRLRIASLSVPEERCFEYPTSTADPPAEPTLDRLCARHPCSISPPGLALCLALSTSSTAYPLAEPTLGDWGSKPGAKRPTRPSLVPAIPNPELVRKPKLKAIRALRGLRMRVPSTRSRTMAVPAPGPPSISPEETLASLY
ncbi:hypothetical protein RhiJN_20841 [Ceratobasidium sp. AG-Ba]|nr:hypothetical protein RhiJN_20841 [Ceratobasidium sp. AG-Ba]